MSFFDEYQTFCDIPSDINEHLPTLYNYAWQCRSIVEFGVGFGRSTRAFIAALENDIRTPEEAPKSLHSYDLKILEGVSSLFARALQAGLDVTLHVQSTLHATFETADLLLVDSHHTYEQVRDELLLHGQKIQKYIIFHDVVLYGYQGQDPGSRGILPAIFYWMSDNPNWGVDHFAENDNGLLVLRRDS